MHLSSLHISHFSSPSKTLNQLNPLLPPPPLVLMFDRLPSNQGAIYVPPPFRSSSGSNSSPVVNTTTLAASPVSMCKRLCSDTTCSNPYPYLSAHFCQTQQQNNAPRDHISSEAVLPDDCTSDELDPWKRKLMNFIQSSDQVELVSREKNDRRDYERISTLACQLGLYSHLYAKVLVVSKAPLPNYRFDLDDKRPLREVILPPGLQKRVETYLEEYTCNKPRGVGVSSESNSNDGVAVDDGLLENQEPLSQSKTDREKNAWRRSSQMRSELQTWQESPEGKKMLEFRHSLPAYKEKEAILRGISCNQVVIISGETGCGKTTQIPQFILESQIESNRGGTCGIICTQPRRISAISVSERVAAERGEKLGETVGYKVRLEGMRGSDTHLLFCTTGILLRRLLVNRNLKGVTHVIVDEIHERGMNEDFLLIVLKDLLPRRPDLRLILMSATLNSELFSSYFGRAPVLRIPGFTYPVQTHFLEDILEMTGYRLTVDNQIDDYGQEKLWKVNKQVSRKRKSQIASAVEGVLKPADYKVYNLQTQESLSCWNPDCIGFNLIEYLLCHICENERPGAVLIFMTGWDDIRSLMNKLEAHPIVGDATRVRLLACHGSMSTSEQRLMFEEPESGIRKIVLATNIAETSITINDIVFVIDCGKAKETSYDALNNAPCLLPTWISKVSAQQRRGRAGRVQPGECYHLYPRTVYDAFADYQLPEILRTPLQSLCLQIKSLKLGSISEFLSKALQSPEFLAVQNAIEYLKIIGALDDNENLTVLGSYLTMLPVEPKLGKMLVLGAIFNCLDPILTIAAAMSVRDPFLTPIEKRDLAEAAKAQFSHGHSDHLALLWAYEGWENAERDLKGYDYCWENFLSVSSMKGIDALREEFYLLLKETGLVDSNLSKYNAWSYDEHLLRAIICCALYPGVCSVMKNEKSFSLKTMEDGQVLLHSNSVNARDSEIPFPWLVFNEKIKVNSVLLRDSTAVSDSVLLLFGGSISKGDMDGHLKMLGGYLEFYMSPGLASMYQSLKNELQQLIYTKLHNPSMCIYSFHTLLSATRLLIQEDRCEGRFVLQRPVLQPPKPTIIELQSNLVCRSGNDSGGENSKGQLQTLLTRAGHAAPFYKTIQLTNNQFQATVQFNGLEVVGKPCNNKKQAEKDAAAMALDWLLEGGQRGHDYIDRMSRFLKRSKRDHN